MSSTAEMTDAEEDGGALNEETTTEENGRHTASCKQCRARKVKCDRRASGCAACERLGFICSFVDNSWEFPPANGENGGSLHELTQGGTKRRRILKACQACHALKAKCTGEEPCSRCANHGQQCVYLPSQRDRTRPEHRSDMAYRSYAPTASPQIESPLRHHADPKNSADGATAPRTVTPEASFSVTALDKRTIRKYIDAYFDQVDPVQCVFLHKASLLSDLNKGTVDHNLLKALCAYGARLCSDRHGGDTVSLTWMRQVETYVLARLHDRSITQLQTLMLLIHYRYNSEKVDNVWMLLALAARLAFAKRLNVERPAAAPIEQESNRRLMWSIWLLDRLFSGGVDDLAVCPASKIHLRLPCNERCFSYAVPSKTQYLAPRESDDGRDMGVLAYMIRVIEIRDQILRYTKRVILDDASPWHTQNVMQTLATELYNFRQSLPEELQLNAQNLTFRAHSPHLTGFVMLHTYWYQCHCDLYRILIPGIRESISASALAATPSDYVEYCQRKCLESATANINFWSDIYHLDARKPIDDCSFAVCAYQCAQIVHNLSNLVRPQEGGQAYAHLKTKLQQTLEMLSELHNSFPVVRGCIADIERIISNFGNTSPTLARAIPRLPTSISERTPVLKLSNLQEGSKENGEASPAGASASAIAASQAPMTRDGSVLASPTSMETPNHERAGMLSMAPNWQPEGGFVSSNPAESLPNGFENMYMFGQDMLYPLDPFDLRLNPYSGPSPEFSTQFPNT